MSYNGSGVFSINSAGQPVVTGTTISSSTFNALTADLATGLTTAMTKDGQTTVTANIPMAGFKFTGLGAGVSSTDSARVGQLQSSASRLLTIAGTDTITATASPTYAAYVAGDLFSFVIGTGNTGAVTLNIDSLGAKAITKNGTVALVAGDMPLAAVVTVIYDGTRFQLLNVNVQTNLIWVDGGGTADAITGAYTPAIVTLIDGMLLGVRATAANATTTPTFKADGTTAQTIVKTGNVALAVGDIVGDGHELLLRYRLSDTKWELLNPGVSVSAASTTVAGVVELATTAETETGTDATRAVTPDGLHDMTTLSGAAWFLDEDTMSSDSAVKTASQQSVKAYADALTGRIRQIVQATKTDTFTTTSTTYTDLTGATLSITPSSASSKVLILCFGAYGMSTSGSGTMITLVRNSTEIIRGDAAGSRVRATTGGDTAQDGQIMPFAITYLDSPATTSATTYKLQVRAGSSGTACIGRAGIDTDNADSSRVPLVIIALEYL